MVLERGTLINNRYRVEEILGQGGMGSVYRAVDENLGVDVAFKENLFTTEEYARQFRREALILANLRHPNLPRVTDHFVIEGQGQYLVMDYIEGEDLRQRMDRIGTLFEEDVIIIGAAICDALTYLEARHQPIIHRDIKPGNVKITPQGQIFLVDFGLAKIVQGTQATTTGARAMTPGYSPPEQYGTARTDHRSDIYSLGATLYAALTGVIPEDALERAMDQAKLTSIRKHNPKTSRRLAAVLEKSLEVRPDDRYQSGGDFKQALLSVRRSIRRITDGFMVDPPPDVSARLIDDSDPNLRSSLAGDISPGFQEQPPLQLPVSIPIEDQVRKSRPRSRWRRRVLAAFLFIVLLLVGGGYGLYSFFPWWPAQTLALLLPSPTSALQIVADTDTPEPTQTSTQTATTTPSPTPVTPDPSPTLTPIDTVTPSATDQPIILVPTPTRSPTPMGGGSGQIAFASERGGTTQVWVMNFEGGDLHQITDMPEGACQPDWSPDGMLLVFISPCRKNQGSYPGAGLFFINPDSSGLTPLPNVPGGDYDPSWSPDGKKIAFTSLRNGGRPRIHVINLDDNSVQELSELYSRDLQPAWSPDGRQIVFVTRRKGPVQIWIMDHDGNNQDIFSRSADSINSHPTWSLDGELILFNQTEPSGGIPGLVAASYTDGRYNEYRFNLGPIPVREARYSPDGLWLVFESWPGGRNHDIYIMTASGAGRSQLTDDEQSDFDPVWRPALP